MSPTVEIGADAAVAAACAECLQLASDAGFGAAGTVAAALVISVRVLLPFVLREWRAHQRAMQTPEDD